MKTESHPPRHKRGAAATRLVLEATLEFAARNGLDATTMEALATHLRIGKATMYRRWPNASALVIDALLSEIQASAPILIQPTVRETFTLAMVHLVRFYKGDKGNLLRLVVGRGQTDPYVIEQISSRWIEPRRKVAREFIRQGIRQKELVAETDPDIMLDCLYGPIYHRLLMPYKNGGLNDEFVRRVVNTVFNGVAANRSIYKTSRCR